jgi:enoyl-CoA hydratase/carnithine racemase
MTASADLVAIERRGPVAVLRYSNPPHGYIAVKGAAALDAALAALLADDTVRGIVLTGGQPGIFIRHADVAQIGRAAEALQARRAAPADFLQGAFPALCHRLEAAEKPVIAALDGICMGGGFEIALCCTLRVASAAAAAIGLPEVRINIFPGSGGTQRLRRLLGPHRARLFILRGEVVDAPQALALGLVDELAASALERAVTLAEGFARRPAGAIAAILDLTRDNVPARFDEELLRFATLLHDEPAVRDRLRQFVAQEERLDEVD